MIIITTIVTPTPAPPQRKHPGSSSSGNNGDSSGPRPRRNGFLCKSSTRVYGSSTCALARQQLPVSREARHVDTAGRGDWTSIGDYSKSISSTFKIGSNIYKIKWNGFSPLPCRNHADSVKQNPTTSLPVDFTKGSTENYNNNYIVFNKMKTNNV